MITARSAGKGGDRRVRAAIGGAGRRWNGPRDQRRSWFFCFARRGEGRCEPAVSARAVRSALPVWARRIRRGIR